MKLEFTVDQGFVDQCTEHSKIYNAGQRSQERLLRDIECEIFEYFMIQQGTWKAADTWKVDGISNIYGNVDVKFVDKYYNIAHKKMAYLAWQSTDLDTFIFCEWIDRPNRLLKAGDVVTINVIGYMSYKDFLKNLQPSNYNAGYYVNVRKLSRPCYQE